MNVTTVECESWADFKIRIISDLFPASSFQKGRFLFRGQGGESWKLASTFDRWYADNEGLPANKVAVANSILEGFIRECEQEDLPPNVRNDRMMMLSLGQHHGLPTRLLDWSESPYVAAFFAFSGHIRHGNRIESNVAIWVLDSTHYIWNDDSGCSIVNVPSFGNERIRNQHGKFTYLQNHARSIEDYVAQREGNESALRKYLVPVDETGSAMADLDAMGLSHSRIYPGLAGNAKSSEVRAILAMRAENR
ncbi:MULTISPECIES: FRG domain-containing protein [unclassified Pseudomonas]|uniref:FRG domain-containing protein n=1 Tax=unclassified Pseudomonas TaxID=196821 RepID=UPI001E3CFE09|nr:MULTISPECIES: FRG domain-containing protein [unclassified Pseudomonas]MCE0915827.1 FRG domain-containing protein [Pseudomonas sp. NMI760_13]MCP8632092.1 FRG domain-containing protein [Pseudomonas sp. DVZ6]MDD7783078.1 FRG domain-containing protein [Pseudomonas sp. DVZ24]